MYLLCMIVAFFNMPEDSGQQTLKFYLCGILLNILLPGISGLWIFGNIWGWGVLIASKINVSAAEFVRKSYLLNFSIAV